MVKVRCLQGLGWPHTCLRTWNERNISCGDCNKAAKGEAIYSALTDTTSKGYSTVSRFFFQLRERKREKVREHKWGNGKEEGEEESESRAGSMLRTLEPDSGLGFTTPRLQPKPKSRVGHFTVEPPRGP